MVKVLVPALFWKRLAEISQNKQRVFSQYDPDVGKDLRQV